MLFLFVAWRVLIYLKLNLFYIPELHFSKTELQEKKKRPTWMLFTEIEKVVQNSPWREAEWHMCGKAHCASVFEFRLDLGLHQGQNTRLSIIVIGQPPNRQRPHSSSGKLLRIFPSLCSISHLVLSSSNHREGFFTSVSWQNTLCSLQGAESQAGAKGAAVLPRWVSSKGAWQSHGQRSLVG